MKREFLLVLSFVIALGACARSHRGPALPPGCVAWGGACGESTESCCDGFCGDTGYGLLRCMAREPEGGFCLSDEECASGRCTGNVCGGAVTICLEEGAGCGRALDCCERLLCSTPFPPLGVAPSVCYLPLACLGQGADCYSSEQPCCEGLVCVGLHSYGVADCRLPLADGEACVFGDECASGRCTDGICRAKTCAPDGVECTSDGGCCEGFCYDTSFACYGPCGPSVCYHFLADESSCDRDFSCASGRCVDSRCVP